MIGNAIPMVSQARKANAASETRVFRFVGTAIALSLLHFIAALATFALGFMVGIRRWDSGAPGALESAASLVAEVLLQPGMRFVGQGMPAEVEWAIIACNSLLWGSVGAVLVWAIRRALERRRGS